MITFFSICSSFIFSLMRYSSGPNPIRYHLTFIPCFTKCLHILGTLSKFFAVQYLPIDSIFILSPGISSTGINSFDWLIINFSGIIFSILIIFVDKFLERFLSHHQILKLSDHKPTTSLVLIFH